MKFLLDIPFVMSVATWVWGGDPNENVSPEFCVEQLPIMNSGCWSRLIVKGLGIAIILGACLNKAPIMLNILNTKSTAGLSRTAVYGDTLIMANSASYGMLEGHPFTAYGETVALLIQSVIIILMVWQFTDNPKVSAVERMAVLSVAAIYVSVVMMLPTDMHYILMASIWPITLFSRGSQILETFKIKHTGAQSIVTTTMNLAGSFVRILTTIKEVGWDMNVLTGYAISVTLNLIMFIQYWVYKSNTEKFLKELKDKKQS